MAERQPIEVVMCKPTLRVPPEILRTVQRHIEEMARILAQLEPESPFWSSVRKSGLGFEVLAWKFKFRMEADKLGRGAQCRPPPAPAARAGSR